MATPERRADAGLLLALAAALLGWFLGPILLHGLRFPVGPDAPVYLWWTRLAGHEGLSAVGHRPGVPALALIVQGTLHVSLVAVVAALECALAVTIGLGAAALVRRSGGDRPAWALAGSLAGTFAVHLAAGYLANLAFAALFLAAAVLLCRSERRATGAAIALLAAGGLAHPLFFLLGLAILLLAAGLAWRSDRSQARRIGAVCLSAGALTGAGLLVLLAGPGPPGVDTSRDAFLRRAGLGDVLRGAYLYRFVHRWTRYVEWASIPLAVVGLERATGFAGRFLRAWGVVLVLGVAVSLATGLAPADRFITFGFAVPILAALGLVQAWRWLVARRGRALAFAATGALTAAMLAGSLIAWGREEPFLSSEEVSRATTASSYAVGGPGTELEFLVNDEDQTVSFLAARAGNVIRASVPPGRIRDVVVRVPWPTPPATRERWALAHVTRDEARTVERIGNGRDVTIVLEPFDRVDWPTRASTRPGTVSPGVFLSSWRSTPAPVSDPLEPSSPAGIAVATFALLLLLTVAGYGWARSAALDPWTAAALAPALGAAVLILLGIALERIGLPPNGAAGPTLVSALGGGGGYLAWLVLERRARARPAPQVDQ